MKTAIIQTLLWSLPTFLLFAACYWCFCLTRRRGKREQAEGSAAHRLGVTCFLLYLAVLLTAVTDLADIWVCLFYRLPLPDMAWFQSRPTLLPYWPGTAEELLQLLLNVLLFLPFGFLGPLLWRKKRPWSFAVIAVCLSLAVEAGQFVTGHRMADINDFLANSLGAVLGFLLWRLCRPRRPAA